MPFVKGQSGNPGGKSVRLPDGRSLTELAREHTADAVKALVRIVKSGTSDSAVVMAASAVLDRGWGRPKQALEHTGQDGGAIQFEEVTADAIQFAGRIAGLVAASAALEGNRELIAEDESRPAHVLAVLGTAEPDCP